CFSGARPPAPAVSPLSLHDALPIFAGGVAAREDVPLDVEDAAVGRAQVRVVQEPVGEAVVLLDAEFDLGEVAGADEARALDTVRSEEHTSELQSRENLVCRLLLEKK